MPKETDKYAQFFYMDVTMSAANTLTFAKLALGISMFDYAGLLLHSVHYFPGRASYTECVTNSDEFTCAVTGSNSIDSLTADQPEVYDRLTVNASPSGTPANFVQRHLPVIHDFGTAPGGGVLVPAQDIYFAMESTGFANPGSAEARVYYTVVKLQATDYLELVQRLRVLST